MGLSTACRIRQPSYKDTRLLLLTFFLYINVICYTLKLFACSSYPWPFVIYKL